MERASLSARYGLSNQKEGTPDTDHILIIKERNHSWAGRPPVRTVHSIQEGAENALVQYVARNWDAEVGDERPSDSTAMVEEYFSEVFETYEIEQE